MPMFSEDSRSKLSTCHIDLQVIFFEVIKHIDCTVLEGYRTQADQDADFDKGVTKLKWPDGKHNHQPSFAVDVVPWPLDWQNLNRFYWFSGFVLGISERLKSEGKITNSIRWGGDWNMNYDITDDHGLKDLVHFELHI